MSKNRLIVESENDKYFIESLKEFLTISDVEIDSPICTIDDYECMKKDIWNFEHRVLDGLTEFLKLF